MAVEQTSFKLNFGRHQWKGNLMAQIEFLKLEEFLIGLQRSWKETTRSIKVAQKSIKK